MRKVGIGFILLIVMVGLAGGCQPRAAAVRVIANPALKSLDGPWVGLEAAYSRLLSQYVTSEARVDYKRLAQDKPARESLDCVLTWTALDPNNTAMGINGYNAAVMRGVLEFYPLKRLSDTKLDFFRDVRFEAGSAQGPVSLEQVAHRLKAGPDWRVAFALAGPRRSDPPLTQEMYTADDLDEQLDRAVKNYLASCAGMWIDHALHQVKFGRLIWERRDWFIAEYQRRFGAPKVSLLTAITAWAWPKTQEQLADVVGYGSGVLPESDWLNDIDRKEDKGKEAEPKLYPCGCR